MLNNKETLLHELCSRVEALEAVAKENRSTLEHDVQAGYVAAQRAFAKEVERQESLVERVALAIGQDDDPINWTPEARAAIREVAVWLKEQGYSPFQAEALEQEAEQ